MRNQKVGRKIIFIVFESWIIPICVITDFLPYAFFTWLANDKGFKETFMERYKEWF